MASVITFVFVRSLEAVIAFILFEIILNSYDFAIDVEACVALKQIGA